MIALGVLTDGRPELLERTIDTVRKLDGIDYHFLVNDSGDESYRIWLKTHAADYDQYHHRERRGLAGAVQSVWDHALDLGCDYLFHLEGDWEIRETIDLDRLRALLASRSDLAQVVLQRQPLTAEEARNGGVAAWPHWTECSDPDRVEQSEIFSLNPCLIPRWVLEKGWPSGPLGVGNESGMTKALAGYRFAFWGAKHSAPAVEHIGNYRADGWSL